MTLNRTEAATIMVLLWCRDDRPQGLIDFLNDAGVQVVGGVLLCKNAEEPSPRAVLRVLKPVALNYIEKLPTGLVFRRETCDQARVNRLQELDAGIGVLSIRAQLLRHHHYNPASVSLS